MKISTQDWLWARATLHAIRNPNPNTDLDCITNPIPNSIPQSTTNISLRERERERERKRETRLAIGSSCTTS
jgi:hypothetical protein